MQGEYITPRMNGFNGNGTATITVIDVDSIPEKRSAADIVRDTRNVFNTGKTKPYEFRKRQLKNLLSFVVENEKEICKALYQDFRKPEHETIISEISGCANKIRSALKNLKKWMKPEEPTKVMLNFFDKIRIYNDPLGVVLVMGAWNYPFLLIMVPVLGAIAAGNCVIIKPSDLAPHTANLLQTILPQYIDKDCYPVYLGGIPETTELLRERFDYIFYTGSTQVGKIIYKAATNHLTPCTLELGGKSPTYVDRTADLDMAVKRILWGKFSNSGQTCIAPDYVLCDKEIQEKFIQHAKKYIKEFYGDNIKNGQDYARIVNERHFMRVTNLLKNQKAVIGGEVDASDLFIQPTILVDVNPDDDIMKEEIFGPVLPIININSAREAIDFINKREKPLAMYIFCSDKNIIDMFLKNTSSGGVTVNDVMMHVVVENLPFGGVGNSGMGAYHGKKSFDTFTHKKSVLVRNFNCLGELAQSTRYPPYKETNTKMTKMALKHLNIEMSYKYLPHLLMFLLGVFITMISFYLSGHNW